MPAAPHWPIRYWPASNNLNQQYKKCDDRSFCVAMAKQIAVVVEARQNVRALAAYLAALRDGEGPDFAASEAGKRSLGPFEILKKVAGVNDAQTTAWIRQTPAFQGVIAALEAVPCR